MGDSRSKNAGGLLKGILSAWGTRWIRGAVTATVILALWYLLAPVVAKLRHLFGDAATNPGILAALIVVLPLLLGWIVEWILNPLLRHWQGAGGLQRLEDRMTRELAPDEQRGFPIVVVPFPTAEVRTLGVLTSSFPAADGKSELAAVYMPGAPHAGTGSLRIVPVNSLESTDWTLHDILKFQWSFGAVSPETMKKPAAGFEQQSESSAQGDRSRPQLQ